MITPLAWGATLLVLAALLAFDLVVSARRTEKVAFRSAVVSSVLYVGVALLFGVVLGTLAGWDLGTQYFAGYIVEKSLSVDNLFVFVIIMSTFAVPPAQQPRALSVGIVIALVLRGIFIALGAALLDAFSVMFLVFGLALVVTAVQLFRHREHDPSLRDSAVTRLARRRLPISGPDGNRFITRRDGRRRFTPLALVLVALGTTDLLFALDSIPAVFGVTSHAYIVFCANAFALLGLRALFFLVSGLLDRLVHLAVGLALILAFIGVKLVLHFAHQHADGVPEIGTALSLGVIVCVLAITTATSLRASRRRMGVDPHVPPGPLRRSWSRRLEVSEAPALFDAPLRRTGAARLTAGSQHGRSAGGVVNGGRRRLTPRGAERSRRRRSARTTRSTASEP